MTPTYFYSPRNYLFQIANQDLENTNQWFISNKLLLNINKNKILILLLKLQNTQKKPKILKSFHFLYQN